MRIIDCLQRSEEWDRCWRNRPTASQFGKFITPAKGQYSTQANEYAAQIVLKRRGIQIDEGIPSYWMDWGIEHEPNAKHAYTLQTGREVQDVGFIIPDGTDAYGGSPDGLIPGDSIEKPWEGLLEIKCPKPETLISYQALPCRDCGLRYNLCECSQSNGLLPCKYKPQVQGLLLISGLPWCDFYVFHPELETLLLRVYPDTEYQTAIAKCLLLLLEEIERIEPLVKTMRHELVSLSSTRNINVRCSDE